MAVSKLGKKTKSKSSLIIKSVKCDYMYIPLMVISVGDGSKGDNSRQMAYTNDRPLYRSTTAENRDKSY